MTSATDEVGSFEVQYLGMVEILHTNPHGQGCVDKVVDQLEHKLRSGIIIPKLILVPSGRGLDVIDVTTKREAYSAFYPLQSISHCKADKRYSRVFAWTVVTSERSKFHCHVAACSDKEHSHKLAIAMSHFFAASSKERRSPGESRGDGRSHPPDEIGGRHDHDGNANGVPSDGEAQREMARLLYEAEQKTSSKMRDNHK